MNLPQLAARVGLPAAIAAASLVAFHEGYIPRTYADPVGIPTACYGHTGPDVMPPREFSRAECEGLLDADLARAVDGVRQCIRIPLTDAQTGALVSFAYNVGNGAFCRSTLVRRANAGEPAAAWCPELSRWTYAKGVQWPGLVRRRQAELSLCLRPDFSNVIGGST